jgi:hypothetical protein
MSHIPTEAKALIEPIILAVPEFIHSKTKIVVLTLCFFICTFVSCE